MYYNFKFRKERFKNSPLVYAINCYNSEILVLPSFTNLDSLIIYFFNYLTTHISPYIRLRISIKNILHKCMAIKALYGLLHVSIINNNNNIRQR
jgi:hypothetical protein